MHTPNELESIQGMDIYLIDQILKGRYEEGQSILDAGAGGGRNLNWFFRKDFDIHACDLKAEREQLLRERFPSSKFQWQTSDLDSLPYEDDGFDHVICNAVLHFAKDEDHLEDMFSELVRVLKKRGSLFIRTCSEIGIEKKIIPKGRRRFLLPDGSERYLIDREWIERVLARYDLELLEPVKSTNVDDLRVMTTLMLVKS